MKYSVIDIGSNSIRLTVYKVKNGSFKILFKEKHILGLAGYVEDGCLTEEGISRAVSGIRDFRNTLTTLGITERIFVFATASLRNVINTDEAASKISDATGLEIDVITGEEEAMLGYTGAMQQLDIPEGAFVDIGGASTEIALFRGGTVEKVKSYRAGSLKLYKECVSGILPGKNSLKRLEISIQEEFSRQPLDSFSHGRNLLCTGGTARAVLKLAKHLGYVSDNADSMTKEVLDDMGKLLLKDKKKAADIILKVSPERIHTMIPGYMILRYIQRQFGSEVMMAAEYGVREGYLCRKILK